MDSERMQRLEDIEGKLLEVFLKEADPDGWINEDKARELAKQARLDGDDKEAKRLLTAWKGERYWEKKNANQTMALLIRIDTYRQRLLETFPRSPLPDLVEEEQKTIAEAEARVQKRLQLVNPKRRANAKG